MGKVLHGDTLRSALDLIGKLAPNSPNMIALQAAAAYGSGGASLPSVAVGMGAKALAGRRTVGDAEELARIVRAGGEAGAASRNPMPGQAIGAGAGLGVLGYPDERRFK